MIDYVETLKDCEWTLPSDYSGANWEGWKVLAGTNRDADPLTRSNFTCFCEGMEEFSDYIKVIKEGHWACGWIEWLGLAPGAPIAAQIAAAEFIEALADYPILNDEHFSREEHEEAQVLWESNYDIRERKDWMKERWHDCELETLHGSFAAIKQALSGDVFPGYASEFIY